MTEKRVDKATGTRTVGHEWDGIEELDTPMPRWWLISFYITIAWGVLYVIFYPAWPLIDRGTEGLLGWTSRGQLAEQMSAVDQANASFREELVRIPIERLSTDSDVFAKAVAGGRSAYQVNCSQCHGTGAAGSQKLGYPNLNDDDWLWGGDLKAIEYTLTNGIRQDEVTGTRQSAMPPFDGVFQASQMDALVDHVRSLGGEVRPTNEGRRLFDDNCAACHGPSGQGNREIGAPRLNDAIWLYGGSSEDIARQIRTPRMGQMPHWGDRLDAATIRMLAAYVWSLGGGEDFVEVAQDPEITVDDEP